jgi:UDPglucose 6-dehydrogenase
LGADIESVRKGMGSDPRIGYHFLYPGIGYGGSCFPKDVQALQRTATQNGMDLKLLGAVEAVNYAQKHVLTHKIVKRFGENLAGKTIALWGLAFKPNTDDMREAPSLVLIDDLTKRGAKIVAFDPVAMKEAKHLLAGNANVTFVDEPMTALKGADALAIVTEWKTFRAPDFNAMKAALNAPVVFDGRNLYEPDVMAENGFEYYPIGRKQGA